MTLLQALIQLYKILNIYLVGNKLAYTSASEVNLMGARVVHVYLDVI